MIHNQKTYPVTPPTGTVTFLFTDIEGSTRLSQQYAADMPALLNRHNQILDQFVLQYHGFAFQIVGDSYSVAFHNADDALQAAVEIQRSLLEEPWSPAVIKVRMGLHTGAAELQDPSQALAYSGYTTIATSQRVMSAGHGGQILLSQATADLIRGQLPGGVQLIDLQEQRLKDIMHPVHIFQINAPGLLSKFPPLKTTDVVKHNLPALLTPFVGREEELAGLEELLADIQRRLITIVAPGGMGKTRLSLEAARQMIPIFSQGLYFVPLDHINSADIIALEIAEALPISLSSNEDPQARIIEYLRDKNILLVLDNFEHVLDGATLVQEILTAAPKTQVLATSRLRLNLMGETIFSIGGLTIGDSDPAQNSAVELFAQSARRVQPKFQLSAGILSAVVRICRLIEGMPLGIVLAAAWIDILTVEEIAAEIAASIDILETEKRDLPQRQRSVRAVIEFSWNQVDSSAQNLLCRLSVYRGGFTRIASQEAAGATLRGLAQLADKALINRDVENGRYNIHELVRQFAAEQLANSPSAERSAYEAHAQFFADFMTRREGEMHKNLFKSAVVDIEADFDNIRVAWTYWSDQQKVAYLRQFLGPLWLYFEVRGSFTPAIQFFGDAARRITSQDPDIICARAEIQARQAWFTALIGLPEEGLRLALDVLQVLEQYKKENINVETLHCITINAIFLNKNDLVAEISQKMLARAERSGDVWERGWALIWSAYALVIQRNIPEALQAGQEALAIFEQMDNPFGLSVATGIILGSIFLAIGQTEQAKAYFLHGKLMADATDYPRMQQICCDNLGTLALIEGELDEAQQYFLQSLRNSEKSGQTREMLASLRDFAQVYLAEGNLEEALRLTAVVLNHPASAQNSLNRPEALREETEKLRTQIAQRFDPDQYQAIWEDGLHQPLAAMVQQLLQ